MSNVRIGVIGLGHLGSLHARMFHEIPSADLIGVTDLDKAKAEAVALQYGTAAYATAAELLEAVDAVSIATPTNAHYAVAEAAIRRRIHVFIEKPITASIMEAKVLVAL